MRKILVFNNLSLDGLFFDADGGAGLRPKDIAEALRRHWVVATIVALLSVGSAIATLLGVSLKDCGKAAPPAAVTKEAAKPGKAPANQ